MKAGWELRKDTCQEVTAILREYVTTYNKYIPTKQEKDLKDFNLFVNGVRAKIEKCLQTKIQIEGFS